MATEGKPFYFIQSGISNKYLYTYSTGVIVNAAYFGSLNEHQISPGNGSTTAKTTTQSLTSASTQLSLPVSYVVLSLVAGLVGLAL
jgi:hypothetical protein